MTGPNLTGIFGRQASGALPLIHNLTAYVSAAVAQRTLLPHLDSKLRKPYLLIPLLSACSLARPLATTTLVPTRSLVRAHRVYHFSRVQPVA